MTPSLSTQTSMTTGYELPGAEFHTPGKINDESSLSLEMDDEACRNVADFFSILNDWQLNNNSEEVGYHEQFI